MNILICEDHKFFSREIIEKLTEDGHSVYAASTYKEAEQLISKCNNFDASILDVILQNGKTGILLADTYKQKLGKVMFITGCIDEVTINRINGKYACASKASCVFPKIDEFLKGGMPQITL